jgi:predicted anti-sigma-YlaC factor YlaD
MDHLSEIRLMELALDPASVPQNGEAAHLEHCAECADRLAEERRLSELLERMPADQPPDDFTGLAVARFERAGRARSLRTLPWALLACLLVLAPLVGIALLSPEPLLESAAGWLAELMVLFRIADTVLGSVPALGVGLVGAMLAATLISVGLLAGLVRRTAAVKYHGR